MQHLMKNSHSVQYEKDKRYEFSLMNRLLTKSTEYTEHDNRMPPCVILFKAKQNTRFVACVRAAII